MAGLLQQQGMAPQGGQPTPQAQPGQPAPQGQPGPQTQGQGGDPRVDMDPQQGPQQRDQLVNAMLESLYGPMLGQVQQILEQGREQPEQAIGRILTQLMLTIWQALSDKGSTVPPGVMVQSAMVAAQAIGEMAIEMGVLQQEGNGEVIEGGFMLAMAQFGQATREAMPPEQRKRYQELLAGLRDAKGMGQQQPQGQPQGAPQPPQGAPQPQQPMQGGM